VVEKAVTAVAAPVFIPEKAKWTTKLAYQFLRDRKFIFRNWDVLPASVCRNRTGESEVSLVVKTYENDYPPDGRVFGFIEKSTRCQSPEDGSGFKSREEFGVWLATNFGVMNGTAILRSCKLGNGGGCPQEIQKGEIIVMEILDVDHIKIGSYEFKATTPLKTKPEP